LKLRRNLGVASALPLALLAAVELYARNFDGWGAWAAAPLFLAPFFLSLAVGGVGVSRIFAEHRAGCVQASTVVSTGIALLPLAWLLVRRHFV
jgi:hypothetical protein